MIIFSDLHAHNFTDYHENRLGLILDTLDKVLLAAHEKKTSVIFCGDIVHKHGYVPTEVIKGLVSVFNRYPTVPFYALSGNHDQATRNSIECPAHSFIDALSAAIPNIQCIDWQRVSIEGVEVIGIPYLASASDFNRAVAHLNPSVGDHTKILICHQTPTLLFNSFIPAQIDITNPELDKYDFVFMGHIHRYQEITKNRFMVGNPIVQDAGDCGDEKGYLTFENNVVYRVILPSVLDQLVLDISDKRRSQVQKAEKIVTLDQRFYSESLEDKFNAFCSLAKLDSFTIDIGKKILVCQD